MLGGIERIEHHQTRIVRPAVGIFETVRVGLPQRCSERAMRKINRACRRQKLPPAEMIINEQPEPQHPQRPHVRLDRQHEPHRANDVRRDAQHHLALGERFAHQPEPGMFEITQPAVNELAGSRRRARGEVVLLDQQHA